MNGIIKENNNNCNIIQIMQIIFSVIGTYGMINTFDINSNAFGIILFILILFSYSFAKINYNIKNKQTVVTIVYSIIICFAFVIGRQLDLFGKIEWKLETLQKLCFDFFAFLPILYLLINKIQNFEIKRTDFNNKKLSLISFGILFIFNLYILANAVYDILL